MTRIRSALRAHWKRYLVMSWATVLAAALVFHFSMTLLYLTPDNPLRVRVAGIVEGYMNPLFAQRWSLFAPDLARDDRRFYVQCRLTDTDGSFHDSPFQDVETFRLEAKRTRKFTEQDRLHRVTNAIPLTMFGESGDRERFQKLIERHPEDERYKVLMDLFENEQRTQFEYGMRLASRAASAECDRMYGSGNTIATRVRIVIAKIPKFSERENGTVEAPTAIKLLWTPYEDVASL